MTDWGTPTGTGTLDAHKTHHQDGGADEISVAALSGLLADDQHVLDGEVTTAKVADAAITQAKLESAKLAYIGIYGVGQYGICLYGT